MVADKEEFDDKESVDDIVNQIRDKKNIYFKDGKLIPNTLAGDIIFDNFDTVNFTGINRGFIVIKSKDREIYRYKDGVYLDDGVEFIQAITRQILGEKATNQRVVEIVTAARQFFSLLIEREKLNKYTTMVNLQNGIFNTETGELLPHDKKYYFTNKMDIIYNKDAKCPNILKFFSEVHAGCDIPIIQEMFGYCMYPEYIYHKIFFMLGTGRNGKGTELNLLTRFIGKRNVASATVNDLITNTFNSAQLFSKLANISGDIGMESIEDAGILKRLSGGDSVMAQHKFGHPFEFINYAKLIYAMNDPPEIRDKSDAMWNRMIHITFPNKFLDIDINTDPHILDKLTTPEEISGLFNWAMEGLKRLKTNGKFSYNKTVEENREAYERKSDPVKGFAIDKLIYADGKYIPKDHLRRIYSDWCKNEKLPSVNDVLFSKKLKDALPGCYPTRLRAEPGDDDSKIRVFMNIALKNESDQSESLTQISQVTQPQQKLDFVESLSDRIQSLLNCIETHEQGMTVDDLNNEEFDDEFIDQCIERKIIHKKPDGTIGVC